MFRTHPLSKGGSLSVLDVMERTPVLSDEAGNMFFHHFLQLVSRIFLFNILESSLEFQSHASPCWPDRFPPRNASW